MNRTRRRVLAGAAATGISLLLPACGDGKALAPTSARTSARGLRIDFRHSAQSEDERFEIAALRREPAPPGVDRDMPAWGDYRLTLNDGATGETLALAGFDSSIDGTRSATALVSVRCPLPARPFVVTVARRRPGDVFRTLLTRAATPADISDVTRVPVRVQTIVDNGAPRERADVAILGDGYTAAEFDKFLRDARRAAGHVFSVEPFRSRSRNFNVHALFVESGESGVTDPYLGVRRSTAFGCAYGSGADERTLAVLDEIRLRDAAAAVPYDFLLVIANARRYGGSAYFGGPAAVAIDSGAARYLVLHELGHAIAGLAEEYYIPGGDGPAYRGNVESWRPNVTASWRTAKWAPPRSGPSEWNKRRYERWFAGYVQRYSALRAAGASEAAVEKLMRQAAARQASLLGRSREVGLFEGADGYARGVYRCEADCIMFSLQTEYYCAACTAALELAIGARRAR